MRRATRFIALLVLVVGIATFASADTMWTLSDVNFYRNPGPYQVFWGMATGTFTVNPALNALTSWDITVSGSGDLVPPPGGDADYHYQSALAGNSVQFFTNAHHFGVANFSLGYSLTFDLASPVTNSGGTIALTSASLDCQGCGVATSGYITTNPVPEPATLLLLSGGVLGLLGNKRRRIQR